MSALAVFGATGGTGRYVVARGLARGLRVVAVARQPGDLRSRHPRLTVLQGDVLDAATVVPAVRGVDAVVSALGIGHSRAATTVYSAGTRNIVQAMQRTGVRRLVCVSTTGLETTAEDTPAQRAVSRLLLQPLLRRPYADMAAMEQVLRDCDRDWTIVRSARLTDGAGGGPVRAACDRRLGAAWSISRADLAEYLLDSLSDPLLVKGTVEVAY